MFTRPPAYLPHQEKRLYQVVSAALYALFAAGLVYGALTFLFPYQRYGFDFATPEAAKNNLFEPHREDFSFPTDGKVGQGDSLIVYANNPQVLEKGDIRITPSDAFTPADIAGTQVMVKKGWAATFFPEGEVLALPHMTIVEYQGNYYEWRGETLHPFVSQAAALSYLPASRITVLTESIFTRLSISEELLGFRPGTLLAYADGVFFVTEESTIRPFGSAEVLLRSGYSFDHVLTASGEDVGIYTRGKIILPGELHLGGTLFQDTDTQQMYVFQNKKLHPLTQEYKDFLSTQSDVIPFSRSAQTESRTCVLATVRLRPYATCQFDLRGLQGTGNDYQIAITNFSKDSDTKTLFVGLQSSREQTNAVATMRSLVTRILERIGLYAWLP